MLELEHGFRVVDVHARLNPDQEAVETLGRDITPELLEREMHQAGIVRSAVSPGPQPAGESYLRENNAVARLSVDRPFITFARVNGPRSPGNDPVSRLRNFRVERDDHHTRPDDIEQYSYDDRFHGFLLVPGYDGLPDEEVVAALDRAAAPLIVHGGPEFPPQAAAETLLGYDFPVILASFGGSAIGTELMDESLRLLDQYDRLYLDTSYVRYRDYLERGLLEHPDRVVFGSGAPDTHPNVGVMEILTLDVSEDLLQRVFTKNATRLIPGLGSGNA